MSAGSDRPHWKDRFRNIDEGIGRPANPCRHSSVTVLASVLKRSPTWRAVRPTSTGPGRREVVGTVPGIGDDARHVRRGIAGETSRRQSRSRHNARRHRRRLPHTRHASVSRTEAASSTALGLFPFRRCLSCMPPRRGIDVLAQDCRRAGKRPLPALLPQKQIASPPVSYGVPAGWGSSDRAAGVGASRKLLLAETFRPPVGVLAEEGQAGNSFPGVADIRPVYPAPRISRTGKARLLRTGDIGRVAIEPDMLHPQTRRPARMSGSASKRSFERQRFIVDPSRSAAGSVSSPYSPPCRIDQRVPDHAGKLAGNPAG